MSRVNTELFIARRISSPEGGRKNVMVRIAAVTVAVGMAVMIVSLAVIGGFKKEITDKLVGFGAHIRVVNLDTNNSLETSPVKVDSLLMEEISVLPYCKSVSTYALKGGIIKTSEAIQGVALKGFGRDYDTTFLASSLIGGRLPDTADSLRHKELLISRKTAEMLELEVDDRVEILFISSSRPVKRDRFKICGIYSTGMDEFDKTITFTDIRNVQRLNGWEENMVSGYEVVATDFKRIGQLGEEVYATVFDNIESMDDMLKVEDVIELNPNIFDWLAAHNVNAIVIIVIMITVALLNMISAMLIILLEKTSMIGILKSLGMPNRSVQKIFLYRSLRIVLKGMIYGNIIGIGLALIQESTHLIKLDSAGYMLSHVPIDLGWGWLVGLNLAVPLVIVILLMIPAGVVSSIKPEKTIRFQ